MKTQLLKMGMALAVLLTCSLGTMNAQDNESPQYITVTTMHWNMDMDDFDMDEWKSVEKEYLEKVTKKNEYVIASSFHMHMFTNDNTELLYVQVYQNWDAIDKASDRNGELAMEAWPDQEARRAFFKKRNSYYSPVHSDEIYATVENVKPFQPQGDKNMITYVRKSKMAYPEDGSGKEITALEKEYFDNVIAKNKLIKGYYPYAHAWGADRTDFVEAVIVDNMGDLEKIREENNTLMKNYLKDEAARKAFWDKYNKYWTGVHEDYIYTWLVDLSKMR